MKINNINNQQNFKSAKLSKIGDLIAKHPGAIAGLAGSSVIAQKVVMSGSEATLGAAMDIGIGNAITKITNEKDERTKESSKKQAIRTFSQSVGGTIVGVVIRGICIAAATAGAMKLGEKAGSAFRDTLEKTAKNCATALNKDGEDYKKAIEKFTNNKYLKSENAAAWGKSIGGAAAIGVMMFTNFIIDAPFINWINKKATNIVDGNKNTKNDTLVEQKEVK